MCHLDDNVTRVGDCRFGDQVDFYIGRTDLIEVGFESNLSIE